MPGLPSPRYSELRPQTAHDANNEDGAKPERSPDGSSDAFLAMDDEERAWSDITARDPGMARRRASRRQRVCSILMSMRSLLDTILLLVILGLLLERGQQRPAWLQVGGDLTGFAPTSKTSHGQGNTSYHGSLTVAKQCPNRSSPSLQTPSSSPKTGPPSSPMPSSKSG